MDGNLHQRDSDAAPEGASSTEAAVKKQGTSRRSPVLQRGPLLPRLKSAAVEHGYTGRLGYVAYGLRFVVDVVLRCWCSSCRFPECGCRFTAPGGEDRQGCAYWLTTLTIDDVYPRLVTIGDGVAVSDGVSSWPIRSLRSTFKGQFESFVAPLTIKDNVWVGVAASFYPASRSEKARSFPPDPLSRGTSGLTGLLRATRRGTSRN